MRRYPKSFYEQRKKIMERDGNQCILCWRGYGLHVHHFPMTMTGALKGIDMRYPDANLLTLCNVCHGKAETCAKGSPLYKFLIAYVKMNGGITDYGELWDKLLREGREQAERIAQAAMVQH